MKTSLKAYAKINIGLRILGRRPSDGYHVLETIFQELDFSDKIYVKVNRSGHFTLDSNRKDIPLNESNLILKAVKAIKPWLPEDLGADIFVDKQIPPGAGLGGGSSDAAAILKFFRPLCHNKPPLESLALSLGADVPFFLTGGTSYATGIGEELKSISIPLDWIVVLVMPPFSISTKQAYMDLRISLTDTVKKTNIPSFLRRGFDWRFFENDFERVIIPAYPQIGVIKSALLEAGAEFSALSGSGSTVYGIFCSDDKARSCITRLQDYGHIVLCQPRGLT
ncbi:TPA: 4-(cytidine 5'-diphospho)-2-C-methyl-D-erythritol kinase [Candidatus Marinimicrobia bacterium]|nr:MAG: 4-diphosphocytidyl-2-C-methyl-D-erythritol kinase [Marinimicrobia bacterium 46_43]HAE87067.1 4-(cytidine 5'-diphospho)-2-C-methyl-D-erythritol kinase [Candidatus Neomarinimicrobiota bacterium]HBY18498.1 4-(cytidine 5'-diphospho)-2-C-methyl-D-erythritol kinase [Candidatus Neomarinimicrobiota bacterium]